MCICCFYMINIRSYVNLYGYWTVFTFIVGAMIVLKNFILYNIVIDSKYFCPSPSSKSFPNLFWSHLLKQNFYIKPPKHHVVRCLKKLNKKSRDTLTCNGNWCHGGSCATERRKQHGGEEWWLGLHDDAFPFLGPRIILLIWRMYQWVALLIFLYVLSHPADTENNRLHAPFFQHITNEYNKISNLNHSLRSLHYTHKMNAQW